MENQWDTVTDEECHRQATLSSWSRIYEVSSSGRVFRIAIAHPVVHAWSPCVHWEDWQLPVILTRFSDENRSQLLEEKISEGKNIFYQIPAQSEVFSKLIFFSFLLSLLFRGGNETNGHYWFLKHVTRGTWEDGVIGEVKCCVRVQTCDSCASFGARWLNPGISLTNQPGKISDLQVQRRLSWN